MKCAVIGLCALLLLAVPAANLCAQSEQNYEDQQNAKEYNDEDSQPLKFASYFVAPIGFVLEWTVMRPLHYLAANTFLAPVFNDKSDEGGPIPTAELPPPDVMSESAPAAAASVSSVPAAPKGPVTASDAQRQGIQPTTPPPTSGGSQPALQ